MMGMYMVNMQSKSILRELMFEEAATMTTTSTLVEDYDDDYVYASCCIQSLMVFPVQI